MPVEVEDVVVEEEVKEKGDVEAASEEWVLAVQVVCPLCDVMCRLCCVGNCCKEGKGEGEERHKQVNIDTTCS